MTVAPSGAADTLVITGRDVAGLMDMPAWIRAAEAAFRALGEGEARAPPPMTIDGVGGAFHAKGAVMFGRRPLAALKLNGNFPGNPAANGLPTIQGALLLCDAADGQLLAILDSIALTLWRTAAASALAARLLAGPDSASVLICGCGAQGRAQLAALRAVLPLTRCFAWDRDPRTALRFAETHSGTIAVEPVAGLDRVAPGVDIIACCTTATAPYLMRDHVRPGAFVAAVGADSPHKSEVDPALMAAARVVADVRSQAEAMGDLRHAIAAGTMAAADVHAELAELVVGRAPGRTSDDQIFIFDSTGTAVQDVAAAAEILRRAEERGTGARLRLGEAA